MKPLGIGIVGCGGIAGAQVEAIKTVPALRIVAAQDADPARAKALAEPLGVPWFTELGALLAHPDVDAVSIATPSGLHRDIAVAAAASGKHVITEKPIEVTVGKSDEMIAACRKAGVTLAMISQYRFHEAMTGLRDAAAEGAFGRLMLGMASTKWYRGPDYYTEAPWRGTWALNGGGSLMNQGIHALDQMLSVFGPVKRVSGYADILFQSIETEDATAGVVEFTSGALGVIETCTCAFPSFAAKVEVMGDRGSAAWELGSPRWTLWAASDGRPAPALAEAPWETYHARQFADFADAVRDRRPPMVTGEAGRHAVAVVRALYDSAKSGRAMDVE